jgi:ADP-ribose pyrophosphatase YjhB (NUDIX family)
MPALTVNVAVISEDRILLTRRDDFEVWCLPGGGVEEGESLARAAIRETKEETGLDVELTSLVGVYSRIGSLPDTHVILFSAIPVGGEIQIQSGETIDVCYFSFDEIPNELSLGHRKRIEDARDRVGGSVAVTQELLLNAGSKIDPKDLAQIRKSSREARIAFYRQIEKDAVLKIKTDVSAK